MDFSWIFEEIICLFFLLVVYCLLGEIGERLQSLRFPNGRGIFKNSIPSNPPKGGPRKSRSRQKERKRGRKDQVTWQDLTQVILSILQEDTPQEDGAVDITDRSTGGSTQPPTDVNNDCSSSDIGPYKKNGPQKKTQAELSQRKLTTETVITGQDSLAAIEVSVVQEESSPSKINFQPDELHLQGGCLAERDVTPAGEGTAAQESLPQKLTARPEGSVMPESKKKTKQLKKKGWMSKKKDLKSPWADWKKTTECKTLVEDLKSPRKIFWYPYQLDTSKTGEKLPKDDTANKEQVAPSLPDNKDERLNKLPEEQSDKESGSTSEQSSEVSSSDIKTQEESDGDKTTSDETTKSEKEIPPDVLRISLVETIYESKAVISGKPTKAGKKKTLGHKTKNSQGSGPTTNTASSAEVLPPNKNVLESCKSHITTVSEAQLKEQGPSSPETATNKTRVEDVSGKLDKDVVHAASPTCDETTLKNTVPARSSPSSDVPGSLEPDADLLERRQLAKIGRKQRAKIRKRIAQEAAQTAIKLRQRLITTDDGEIVINRDQEDWAEVVGLPFSITVSFVLKYCYCYSRLVNFQGIQDL
ncbi:hypothetical protein HOLleu_34534 [Holothuria leucospilota]|uniref:Uncharacterized protein n=1 Tax=Holothuria leucospilota TaxID=206669 RepID=A0A9Q1BGS1_HOLLE|nr:hypothetical protein HOLleu_34534 [Holothuria leucospilota]